MLLLEVPLRGFLPSLGHGSLEGILLLLLLLPLLLPPLDAHQHAAAAAAGPPDTITRRTEVPHLPGAVVGSDVKPQRHFALVQRRNTDHDTGDTPRPMPEEESVQDVSMMLSTCPCALLRVGCALVRVGDDARRAHIAGVQTALSIPGWVCGNQRDL